jgi:hypothetical protein
VAALLLFDGSQGGCSKSPVFGDRKNFAGLPVLAGPKEGLPLVKSGIGLAVFESGQDGCFEGEGLGYCFPGGTQLLVGRCCAGRQQKRNAGEERK